MIDFSRPYTFSQYFEQQIPADELISGFAYGYERGLLPVPDSDDAEALGNLNVEDLVEMLKRTRTSNEQTKREIIVSRLVQALVLGTDALLRIEYSISVSPQLQGVLDYLISKEDFHQLVIIEAKRNDLDYGFTQLAAQMICLDQWERSPTVEQQPVLVGAVTTGEVWKFARLDRRAKRIVEGLNLLTIPDEIPAILKMLRQGILN